MTLSFRKVSQRLCISVGAGVILAGVAPLAMVSAAPSIAIGNCQVLQKIGNDVAYPLNGDYVLSGNIDCTPDTQAANGVLYNGGDGFAPIGDSGNPFTGTLNGQGYTITGLRIHRPTVDRVGLFSYTQDATIENIHFVATSITASSYAGVVSGQEESINLNNVTVNGDVTTPANSDGYVSGVIGYNSSNSTGPSQLTRVYFSGSVASNGYSFAGLIGDNDGDAVITESGSSANITCNDPGNNCEYVGGLVGDSDGDLTISKSFATGNVNADTTVGNSVGGLVGWSDNDTISNSFATGNIFGKDDVGGLLGSVNSGTVDKSYSSNGVTTTGTTNGAFIGSVGGLTVTNSFFNLSKAHAPPICGSGACGATGLSNSEMQNNSNFTGAGWDFTNIWRQNTGENSGLPFLQWASADSKLSPVTGKKFELVLPAGCVVDSMSLQAESSNVVADAGFSYPDGMLNFSANCGAAGFTTRVTSYVYGVTSGNYVVRKYNPITKEYATVPGAAVSFVTINGEHAAKIVYLIHDGGPLDNDGLMNGTIVDPVGLAVSTGAPDTGFGAPAKNVLIPISIGMLVLGGVSLIVARKYMRG